MTVAAVTPAEGSERSRRGDAFLVLGLAVGIVAVAVARLVVFGWAEIAPDDARYVYVGLSTLDGHGPITPSGNVFLLRSPVYGIALAAGRWLGDGGPVGGARIVGAGLAVTALVVAVALSHSLAGVTAAVGTTLAILAMTLIWRLVPTIRIDLPQTAGVVAALLALQRPTIRRWAVAGALLGLTILVKETVILLAAAPLAFAGTIAPSRLVRLWAGYLGVAVLVAGWWWVVVWTVSGALFPLNAVAVIERRDVGTDLLLDTFGLGLLGLTVAAWILVAGLGRDDRRIRLLVAAAACLLPPALYALANGLSTRNLAGLAVLSAVAIGVAASRARQWIVVAAGGGRPIRLGVPATLLVLGAALAIMGQGRAGDPVDDPLPAELAAGLRPDTAGSGRIVMAFRDREVVALALYGERAVALLAADRVAAADPLSAYVWMGLRDRQLFGITRSAWVDSLSQPGTTRLVLVGPHPLTPAELRPTIDHGGMPGLDPVRRLEARGEWATIDRVAPDAVGADVDAVALHLSPAAAIAWLDLVGGAGQPDAAEALVQARPLVVGSDRAALEARFVGLACFLSSPADGADAVRVAPVGRGCP